MTDERLSELYRLHSPAIFARCCRMLSDDSAAMDATQETFLRVHRHLAKAPSGAEALAWIYRIATNVCLNQIRERQTRKAFRDGAGRIAEPGLDLDAQLDNRELARSLIARLPEDLATAAWLHFVDGLNQTEVAEVLGLSRNTVVNRLAAFRTRASALLERAK